MQQSRNAAAKIETDCRIEDFCALAHASQIAENAHCNFPVAASAAKKPPRCRVFLRHGCHFAALTESLWIN
jgi:hypothetical protein